MAHLIVNVKDVEVAMAEPAVLDYAMRIAGQWVDAKQDTTVTIKTSNRHDLSGFISWSLDVAQPGQQHKQIEITQRFVGASICTSSRT